MGVDVGEVSVGVGVDFGSVFGVVVGEVFVGVCVGVGEPVFGVGDGEDCIGVGDGEVSVGVGEGVGLDVVVGLIWKVAVKELSVEIVLN